jgi:ABC-type uncharacterized transport system ATPase subunit
MIWTEGLCKFYGPFAAVNEVTFAVPRRQVCAFLGPNGAGKSTTMKLLTGFLAPTRGSISIAGHDMQTDRIEGSKHIGYLPDEIANEYAGVELNISPKSAFLPTRKNLNVGVEVTLLQRSARYLKKKAKEDAVGEHNNDT